ncbi:MAG TPA: substrate-binding domain-containing protein, partial [Actinoplanes sp.]|nr:substrate-binding domain-containing protein [Actinoplanes sp.]
GESAVETRASELARRHGVPAVLLGERIRAGTEDHVATDGAAAARDAVRHLLRVGRRRIAAIGAPVGPAAVTWRQRLAGYRSALADAGLGPVADPRLEVPVTGQRRADGAAAMQLLLARAESVDAIFCFTDLLALGAIRTLVEHGIDVPGDIAVMGFGGIEEGRYSNPSLSTIDPDTPRIAQLAVDLLAERLGERPATAAPPREICVEHRIIARESTVGRP